MKFRPSLLALSLATNLALLGWWLVRDPAPDQPAILRPSSAAPASSPSAAPLSTLPAAALREQLLQLGLPTEAVTALVRTRIYARHDARRRELLAAALSSLPWWKAAKRPPGSDPILLLTPAQRNELHDLEAEARAATLAQLGPAALDPEGNLAARYAFLSPEKAVLLNALERDYENLHSDLRETLGRVRTPADREQEQLLETERQRDLAALLSPAEREALEQRSSPAARRLASRMLAFQATEEEYRALYAIQQSFDGQFPSSARPTPGTPIPSLDSQPEFTKKIRDALGGARFADWETSSQMHVQALARLAVVNNLPAETVREVASILRATADSSWSIVSDHNRPADQRTAALAQLAADTRGQITAKLGADTATKYLRDVAWFEPLANGTGVRLTPNGGLSLQGVSRLAPPPAAPTSPPN